MPKPKTDYYQSNETNSIQQLYFVHNIMCSVTERLIENWTWKKKRVANFWEKEKED